MALDVETYFVLPLIDFYGKDPTDQVREHVNTRLDGTAPKVLQDAVEWLKNHRRTLTSFPPPKDCLKAVDEARQGKGRVAKAELAQSSGVTAESYPEVSAAHVKAKKRCVMIDPGTEEWAAWKAYFGDRNCVEQIEHMDRVRAGKVPTVDRYAVPERWPWDFDRTASRALSPVEEDPVEDKPALPEGPWRAAFAACLCRQDFRGAQRVIDAYKAGQAIPGRSQEAAE